jgi:flagellar assembly protein FliH
LSNERVIVRGGIRSVRVLGSSREDPRAAAERARRAEEEARLQAVRDEAFATARSELRERFQETLADLATERDRLRDLRNEVVERLEPHVLDLAVAIARRLVAEEIAEGRFDVRPVVEQVLRELREPGAPTVLEVALNPDDFAVLGAGTIDGVRVTADDTVPRAACVVTTDTERIWSDLETRVRNIRRALRDAVGVTR